MNKFVKYIVESKFNFNIDIEDSDNTTTLSKQKQVLTTQKQVYETSQNLVDLELPSKTLWCRYNLGVNVNQLSQPNDWNGGHYAWGETKSKKKFTRYNHKFYSIPFFSPEKQGFTKYVMETNKNAGVKGYYDNLSTLEPCDDAVTKYYSDNRYHIPTVKQWAELQENTEQKFIHDYNGVDDLKGILFTSNINGNTLFFPLPGMYNEYADGKKINPKHWESGDRTDLEYGVYWTSELDTHSTIYGGTVGLIANCVGLLPGGKYQFLRMTTTGKGLEHWDCTDFHTLFRIYGCSIRGVYNEEK